MRKKICYVCVCRLLIWQLWQEPALLLLELTLGVSAFSLFLFLEALNFKVFDFQLHEKSFLLLTDHNCLTDSSSGHDELESVCIYGLWV